MRQILQDIRSGTITIQEVPVPAVRAGHLVIETRVSLISAGTERMLLKFGKAGWLEKIRQQPEKVRQVLNKIQTDGLLSTLAAVRSKLDEPITLGYCNAGVVCEVGSGVEEFAVGDRVVSNGPHAEVVCVPQHLCAKIPDNVDETSAAFTVTGSIGLQGIHLLSVEEGAFVAVIGLGLIGLQAVQMLRAYGVRVIGFDPSLARVELARALGVQAHALAPDVDPVMLAHSFSNGRGVNAVLITASTKSNGPIHSAAQMCRPRGKIVLTGVVGLELNRDDFYKKEIAFQVSSSYGSDRYEVSPHPTDREDIGTVGRWTVRQNFEIVLSLMEGRSLKVDRLVSAVFSIGDVQKAYEMLLNDKGALGIVLDYKDEVNVEQKIVQISPQVQMDRSRPVVGFIGAGNFARRTLIQAFKISGARLKTVVSSGGVSGVIAGKKYGFEQAGTDIRRLLEDKEINTVVVTTPHNTHARFVIEALRAGKHVFVEKPLCLTREELQAIQEVYEREAVSKRLLLMVGFNRRFAPLTVMLKQALQNIAGPKSLIITVNAGLISKEHWTQDHEVGGGRIIGEACHFIDLARFLVGSPTDRIDVAFTKDQDRTKALTDTATITLIFKDGSVGTIHYLSNGSKRFPKERIEVFGGGRVFQIDNFRKLRQYGKFGTPTVRRWNQDKGHNACVAAFMRTVSDGEASPISFEEIVEVSEATLRAAGI